MSHAEFGSGRTRLDMLIEFFKSSGLGGRARVLPKHKVDDGINAVRMVLDECEFDVEKCKRGLECLKAYSKSWDDKNAIFREKPKHDWASHSADAFRIFAMGRRDTAETLAQTDADVDRLYEQADNDYNIFGGR